MDWASFSDQALLERRISKLGLQLEAIGGTAEWFMKLIPSAMQSRD
jgi:hypothetical protein